jgi:hypothetical protein
MLIELLSGDRVKDCEIIVKIDTHKNFLTT